LRTHSDKYVSSAYVQTADPSARCSAFLSSFLTNDFPSFPQGVPFFGFLDPFFLFVVCGDLFPNLQGPRWTLKAPSVAMPLLVWPSPIFSQVPRAVRTPSVDSSRCCAFPQSVTSLLPTPFFLRIKALPTNPGSRHWTDFLLWRDPSFSRALSQSRCFLNFADLFLGRYPSALGEVGPSRAAHSFFSFLIK